MVYSVSLNVSTPPSHTSKHVSHDNDKAGGVADVHDASLPINPKPKLNHESFETLALSLPSPAQYYKFSEFLSGSTVLELVVNIDHQVLFDRLNTLIGIKGAACATV